MTNTGTRIAVIGSGISGLSSAFYIHKALSQLPTSAVKPVSITIFESNKTPGGWLRTHPTEKLEDGSDQKYRSRPQEMGARLIKNDRAADLLWEIVDELGMAE